MKKSQFTEEQVVVILAEADRGEKAIGDVCRSPKCRTRTGRAQTRRCGGSV